MKSDQTKYRALSHRKTKVLKVHFFRTPKRTEVLELIFRFQRFIQRITVFALKGSSGDCGPP